MTETGRGAVAEWRRSRPVSHQVPGSSRGEWERPGPRGCKVQGIGTRPHLGESPRGGTIALDGNGLGIPAVSGTIVALQESGSPAWVTVTCLESHHGA